MDETNVNKLNGIPNFGFGLPEDGIVVAGITDVPTVEEPEQVVVLKKKKTVSIESAAEAAPIE